MALLQSAFLFFKRNAYRKEMALVILLKIIILFLFAKIFFAHPLTAVLNQTMLAQHFLGK